MCILSCISFLAPDRKYCQKVKCGRILLNENLCCLPINKLALNVNSIGFFPEEKYVLKTVNGEVFWNDFSDQIVSLERGKKN